jgi:hypothetical protein
VNQYRESSHISVITNGGNVESFHINLPRDRVMAGMRGRENSTPYGLDWPDDEILGGSQTEIFKLRDKNNVVVGLASRISSHTEVTGAFVEWMLHLPARGSMFIAMQLEPGTDGNRNGMLRSGTGEFASLTGQIRETFIPDFGEADSAVDSRIQLVSVLSGSAVGGSP